MSKLEDLRAVADDLTPAIKELFALAAENSDLSKTQKANELAAVKRLKKLVAEGGHPTKGSFEERATAIASVRTALTEVLKAAASNAQPLPVTTVNNIQAQRNALRNAFGLLLERTAFEDIPQLLPPARLEQMSNQLAQAQSEIEQRVEAKRILDATVSVLLAAGKIATRLA